MTIYFHHRIALLGGALLLSAVAALHGAGQAAPKGSSMPAARVTYLSEAR